MCRFALFALVQSTSGGRELTFPEDRLDRRADMSCVERYCCRRFRVMQYCGRLLRKLRTTGLSVDPDLLTMRRCYAKLSLFYVYAGAGYLLYFVALRIGLLSLVMGNGVVPMEGAVHAPTGGSDSSIWTTLLVLYNVFYWGAAPLISVLKIALGALGLVMAVKGAPALSLRATTKMAQGAAVLHAALIVLNVLYVAVTGGVALASFAATQGDGAIAGLTANATSADAALIDAFSTALSSVYVFTTIVPRLVYVVVDFALYGSFFYVAAPCYAQLAKGADSEGSDGAGLQSGAEPLAAPLLADAAEVSPAAAVVGAAARTTA